RDQPVDSNRGENKGQRRHHAEQPGPKPLADEGRSHDAIEVAELRYGQHRIHALYGRPDRRRDLLLRRGTPDDPAGTEPGVNHLEPGKLGHRNEDGRQRPEWIARTEGRLLRDIARDTYDLERFPAAENYVTPDRIRVPKIARGKGAVHNRHARR